MVGLPYMYDSKSFIQNTFYSIYIHDLYATYNRDQLYCHIFVKLIDPEDLFTLGTQHLLPILQELFHIQ